MFVCVSSFNDLEKTSKPKGKLMKTSLNGDKAHAIKG